jgi:hypothetical protein
MTLLELLFNNDTGANYSDAYMYYGTSASTVGGGQDTNRAGGSRMAYLADDSVLGSFSSFTLLIPNYSSGSTMHRSWLCRSGMSHSTADYFHYQMMNTGTWHDTDAIDRIKITEAWGNASGFQQYSTMSLYGISVS